MAPEQFKTTPYDPFKAEIYSLGMLLFHMIFKAFPFNGNSGTDPEALNALTLLKSFVNSEKNIHNVKPSKYFIDLLALMMEYNPDKRATIDDIIGSRWYREQEHQLLTCVSTQKQVRCNLMSRLQYVTNLTKVKIEVDKDENRAPGSANY